MSGLENIRKGRGNKGEELINNMWDERVKVRVDWKRE